MKRINWILVIYVYGSMLYYGFTTLRDLNYFIDSLFKENSELYDPYDIDDINILKVHRRNRTNYFKSKYSKLIKHKCLRGRKKL